MMSVSLSALIVLIHTKFGMTDGQSDGYSAYI